MKTCTKCGEEKPCSEYSVRRASRGGLTPACKTCVKARDKAYRATNVDRIKAQHAEYRATNADRLKAQQAEYQAANPHIGWESDYRSRCRAYGYVSVVESFTREEMIAFWNNGEQCIYCNGPFQEADHVIPVGLGGHHVISNVAPSCTPCNRVNTNAVSNTRKTLTND